MKLVAFATLVLSVVYVAASPVAKSSTFSSGKSYGCGSPDKCHSSGGYYYKSDSKGLCHCPDKYKWFYGDKCGGSHPSSKWKRAILQEPVETVFSERDALKILSCPYTLEACPLPSGEFECVDTEFSLDACGTCNTNCLTLPNVLSVSCIEGACEVYDCNPGYELVDNACIKI